MNGLPQGGVVRARAPGKIILSGEHAVLYGCPALLTAVPYAAECTVQPDVGEGGLRLTLEDLGVDLTLSAEILHARAAACVRRYDAFLEGQGDLSDVLREPEDAAVFALSLALNAVPDLKIAAQVRLRSDIPAGRGMGSSAATALALLAAVAAAWKVSWSREAILAACVRVESLHHGHSSGADPAVCQRGGMLWFREGRMESRPVPRRSFYLLDTGKPQSSTGECVMDVARRVGRGGPWADFSATTHAVTEALAAGDGGKLGAAVKANQRLLESIGVVPPAVAARVADIEQAGGAAKICGAGSVRGQAAGMLWIVGTETLYRCLRARGWPLVSVEGHPHGVCVG